MTGPFAVAKTAPGQAQAGDRSGATDPGRQNSMPAWRADVQALSRGGDFVSLQRQIPALPDFEAAFGGFARGTLLQTEHGPVAVEDLLPGDMLPTADGGLEQVLWIGKMHYTPRDDVERSPLIRLLPDALGLGRPETFANLGPYARVLRPLTARAGYAGESGAVSHVAALVDGDTIVEALPPREVQLYHLSLRRHAAVFASGLPVETYHPGVQPLRTIPRSLHTVFEGLFPHVDELSDFGPLRYARVDRDISAAL